MAEGPTALHVRFKVGWTVVDAVPVVIVVAGIINVMDVVLSFAGDGRCNISDLTLINVSNDL